MKNHCLFSLPHQDKAYIIEEDTIGKHLLTCTSFDSSYQIQLQGTIKPLDTFDTPQYDLLQLDKSQSIDKESYIQFIQQTIQEITDKKWEKVVVGRKLEVPIQSEPYTIFESLSKAYPNVFTYLLYYNQQCWIGATPETLLSLENQQLHTMALAGTLPNSCDFAWGIKELEEHYTVVHTIVNTFEKVGLKPQVHHTQSISLNQLKHLETLISADVCKEDLYADVLHQLHPTPAVAGEPRDEVIRYILEKEPLQRELYTGYIDIHWGEKRQAFVNLRCGKIYKNTVELFVGGGINAKSIPEKEWEETQLKAQTLINHLK